MLNIKEGVFGTYIEAPQNNPIRWCILFKEGEGVFRKQAGIMRCRDFFNDLVAAKRGHFFHIYGFANNTIQFNEEGLYILLSEIGDMEMFSRNTGIVAAKMLKQLGKAPLFQEVDEHSAIVRLPNICFESTYNMSLTTWLLRLSNYNVLFEGWDDLFVKLEKDDKFQYERNCVVSAKPPREYIQLYGFCVPEKVKGEWYYAGADWCGSSTSDVSSSIIHNNGVCSFLCAAMNEDEEELDECKYEGENE